MATNRKYAALPDLDSAQDIYETPDLTDGVSTLQTSASPTSASHRLSISSAESGGSDHAISRSRLDPTQARSQFSSSRIDARDVDFSDRVSSKRKAYKTTSRRHERGGDPTAIGDFSDDEDTESLERKIARLRREIEEVKVEVGKRRVDQKRKSGQSQLQPSADERSVDSLSEVIEGLHIGVQGSTHGAPAAMVKQLSTQITIDRSKAQASKATNSTAPPIDVAYTPSFTDSHALTKAAAFDTRLGVLEKLVGLSTAPAQTSSPILPTLATLSSQIHALTNTSSSTLEAQGRRVRQLTNEAEKLVETRRAAQTALEDARNRKRDLDVELLGQQQGGTNATESARNLDRDVNVEQELKAKVNSLFAALSTVERLEPLLSPVLERLRSLRRIHGEAAAVAEGLEGVEKRQAEMDREIERWAEGLGKVEGAIKESGGILKENTEVIEGWIKGLEERMQRLGD